MRWPSRTALALTATAALTAVVGAEPIVPAAVRDRVRAQLDAEVDSVDRARAAVDDKRSARLGDRERRTRAAYRALRVPAPPWASADERMADARLRATARHLLARDAAEVAILDDEAAQLDLARARLGGERAIAEVVAMPADLAWPAEGKVALRTGTVVDPASRARMSRWGLEIDVPARADARAISDGTVRYAGPIRGLDLGVIVDHGSFVSVVAHLGQLRTHAGDAVRRGAVLGSALDTRVHLEIRVEVGPGGRPIDPETVLPSRR